MFYSLRMWLVLRTLPLEMCFLD
uniref:Uncharacterized protein n=1 Tax=Anguilla anguilla TaxID=7936 RepID=A0A0E9R5V8_ANGAN